MIRRKDAKTRRKPSVKSFPRVSSLNYRSTAKGDHTIVFVSLPMPSISHVTTSPFLRNVGVAMPIPTPLGVPVAMIVPAFSVTPCENWEMILAMLWMSMFVFAS